MPQVEFFIREIMNCVHHKGIEAESRKLIFRYRETKRKMTKKNNFCKLTYIPPAFDQLHDDLDVKQWIENIEEYRDHYN